MNESENELNLSKYNELTEFGLNLTGKKKKKKKIKKNKLKIKQDSCLVFQHIFTDDIEK